MKPDDNYLKQELYSLVKKDSSIFEFLEAGSLDGIWYWDLENPEHEWLSPRFWQVLGYDPEEKAHLASEWQGIIFPEDLEIALGNFNKHCADPNYPYDQIVRYRHKDGSTVWIRCRGIVIRDEAGTPVRMLGAHTDITPIKRAEIELRESEEFHRLTMENIMDLVFITDDTGHFTFICTNVQQLLGFSEEELRHKGNIRTLFEMMPFDIEKRISEGIASNIDVQIRTKSGQPRNYLLNVKRVSIRGGTLLYVFRDITERKQLHKLNEQYHQSQRLYKDLVETSQDLIWQCDLEGKYTYLNPEWENTFGYKVEEMMGRRFSDFQSPQNAHRDKEEFSRILQGHGTRGYESLHIGKDDKPIHLVFNAKPIVDEMGNVVGTRGTAHNITTRHKAQAQLKKSNDNYQNLFEKMLDGFALHEIICDADGAPVDYRFLSVNPAFELQTGLKAEDIVGKTVLQVMPGTEKHWIDTYGRVALTGEPIYFENYSQELDKYFTVSAYRPAKGQFVCIFQDITESRKSEQNLLDALKFNQLIIETSPAGLLIFKESGPCVMTNPEAARIAAATEEELLNLNFREMESYRKSGILADMEKVLVTGEVVQREIRVVNTFGKDVWFDGSISCFSLNNEKHILFLFQDVWDRKRLEAKIIKQHAEFQAIFNSITDAIIFVDEKRSIIRVNPAFEANMGYSQEEVLGRTTQFIYANPLEYEHHKKLQSNIPEKNTSPVYKIDYQRRDGSIFQSETLSIPVKDSSGQAVGFLSVIRDVTERNENEREKEELKRHWQQSQKLEAIGTLAGGIAHDFNNMLGVIIGYTDLAASDMPPGTDFSNDLARVSEAATRAKELVQQILTFSRKSHTERSAMKPESVVKEALKLLRASIPTTIKIIDEVTTNCGFIEANPTQIHQILMNLCTNAFHAMEKSGGILKVSLKPTSYIPPGSEHEHSKFIELSISDSGHGISQDIIDKIFDPFFTTKEAGKGTGMGLSIVYGIIKEYGGHIAVESQPGTGTTFRVYLPIKAINPVRVGQTRHHIIGGNERILFVDDEEMLAQMNRETLRKLGYDVTVMVNSGEALELFRNQPQSFDLVITDQTMPVLTGLELAEKLLRIRPDIPIILCTGYSSLVDEKLAKAAGIKEFTFKPLTMETISGLIRKVLDQA